MTALVRDCAVQHTFLTFLLLVTKILYVLLNTSFMFDDVTCKVKLLLCYLYQHTHNNKFVIKFLVLDIKLNKTRIQEVYKSNNRLKQWYINQNH